jgi:phosphate transport system permease protein
MTASAGNPPVPVRKPIATRRSAARFQALMDLAFRLLCQAAAVLVIVVTAALVAVLVWQSWDSLQTNGLAFFTSDQWDPEPTHRKFGALSFVYGTVVTSVMAMLLAVPLGVGTAAYLAEIAPRWVRRPSSFMVEMLAAVPSVVYGFWGLFVFAPAFAWLVERLGGPGQAGVGLLPAGLILGVMIVPYITAVSFDVIRAVPRSQREGALALGATRWQVIWRVVLPYARPGIIGGCFLGLGRALGETMAVTMLIGNYHGISWSLFGKGDSIPSVIANQFTEATYDLYLSALVELGLVLLLVSVAFSALGRLLIWRVGRGASRRSVLNRAVAAWWKRQAAARARDGAGTGTGSSGPANGAAGGSEPGGAAGGQPPPAPASEPVQPGSAPRRRGLPSNVRWAVAGNALMTVTLGLCLIVTVAPLFLILGFLLFKGATSLDWDFFTKLPKPVGEKGGGIAHAFYGSAVMVGLATAFSVPVGLLAAIYLSEYRSRWLGPTVRFVGEMLGSVPSIVMGIFGYYAVVKLVTGNFSGLAGGFALGVMMIPIIMRTSEEALKLVPRSLRHASFALGASHWQTVLRVTVPAALPAVITAVFLGIARVAGETAPLLLTAGGNDYWPRSVNDFYPSLPVYIFRYAESPYADWNRKAWAAAFVLLVIVLVLNFGVRLLAGKRVLLASQAD